MAIRPCSLCGKRFRGAAQAAYPSLLHSSIRSTSHLRLCDACFKQLVDQLNDWFVNYDEDDSGSNACPQCGKNGQDQGDPVLFATLYPAGAERWDAMGLVHSGCAQALASNLRLL